MMNALAKWFASGDCDEAQPRVKRRHSALSDINATVTEYGQLLEQVSADRAELLKTISVLQIKNAELSVSKAVYSDLEAELSELRRVAESALRFAEENRELRRTVDELRTELETAKREASTLKGQLTKARNAK